MAVETEKTTTNKAQSSRWARERSEKESKRERMRQQVKDGRLIIRPLTDMDRQRYQQAIDRRL